VFVLMLENRSFDHLFALSGIANITAASPGESNAYGGIVYPFGGGAATLNASGFGFDVHGVRVPAIVVSPWVAA